MDEAVVLKASRAIDLEDTDETLATAARADRSAFATLYARHRLRVFRYLRTRTTSDDDAVELTAITFERALSSIDTYRPRGGGFPAWLLRIARNAAIDQARRATTVELPLVMADPQDDATPETRVLVLERRRVLGAALNALPETQREAIALRYAAGLTAREIGAVIGKSDVATQQLLRRALQVLREQIRDDL
jgi:RNA polymerase sigma-70 factor, ECF subfamily